MLSTDHGFCSSSCLLSLFSHDIPVYAFILQGENGNGKTTLVKLMLGELTPLEGEIRRSNQVRFALVNQHHADQIDFTLTPLQYMLQQYPGDGSYAHEQTLRGHLSTCGVTGEALRQRELLVVTLYARVFSYWVTHVASISRFCQILFFFATRLYILNARRACASASIIIIIIIIIISLSLSSPYCLRRRSGSPKRPHGRTVRGAALESGHGGSVLSETPCPDVGRANQ